MYKINSRHTVAAVPRVTLLLCAFACLECFVPPQAHADQNGLSPVTVNRGDDATAAELGVDIYPGARQSTRAIRMKVAGEHFVTVKLVTSDSEEQVLVFYKSKLGADALTTYHMGNAIIGRGNRASKESVQVTIVPHSAVDEGKTQITILHNIKD